MTNKEASEILTQIKNTPRITWTNGADIAFDLAIKALEVIEDLKNVPSIDENKLFVIMARQNGKLAMMLNALRPHGKWIISEIQCPNCLEYFQTDCYSTEELKKCPICGEKMDEEANNEQ